MELLRAWKSESDVRYQQPRCHRPVRPTTENRRSPHSWNEPRPWDGSDERLHQLQEKFNAYVSFLLDGEMAAAFRNWQSKSARIELRCDPHAG